MLEVPRLLEFCTDNLMLDGLQQGKYWSKKKIWPYFIAVLSPKCISGEDKVDDHPRIKTEVIWDQNKIK